MAIIAVLATLVTAGLSSAKRKGNKTVSINNLRQISLGVNLYMEDDGSRPFTFTALVTNKYVGVRSLLCPEDKTMNWAGQASTGGRAGGPPIGPIPGGDSFFFWWDIPHSYFGAFSMPDPVWERIMKSPLGGVAACQLHGFKRRQITFPTLRAYEGLVLRALKDGAVIPRQVFWTAESIVPGNVTAEPALTFSDLEFFLDPVESP